MTDSFLLCSNALTGALRVVIGLFLTCRLLSAQKLGKKGAAAGLAGGLILAVPLSLASAPAFCRSAAETILIAACASRLQHTELRMSLFVGIFYEIGVSFWRFLLTAWPVCCRSFLDNWNVDLFCLSGFRFSL